MDTVRKYPKYEIAGFAAKTRELPWLDSLYLAVCFFAAVHDPLASINYIGRTADSFATTAGTGSLPRQISFLMLALYGVVHLPRWFNQRLQRRGAVSLFALLLCAWTILSLSWSQSPSASGARLIGLMALILTAGAICLRFRPKEIVRWIGLTTLGFTIFGFLCELVLGTFRPWAIDYRFAGTLHPNEQGVNCALAAIASWYLWRLGSRRTFWLGSLVVTVAFTLLTKSRAAFASEIIALALTQMWLIPNWRKWALTLSVAGSLLVGAAWLQYNGVLHVQGWTQMGRDDKPDQQSLTGRVPLWNELLDFAAQRPVLGYGYGGFWTPDRVLDVSADQRWGVSAAHSAYVEILLALGPIGLCLYTTSLLLGVRRARLCVINTTDWPLAFFGTVEVFCLVNGIADSASVNVSSFLCFCSILSLIYIGFIGSGSRNAVAQHPLLRTETEAEMRDAIAAGSGVAASAMASCDVDRMEIL